MDDGYCDHDYEDEGEDFSSTRSGYATTSTGTSSIRTYDLVLAKRNIAYGGGCNKNGDICGTSTPPPHAPDKQHVDIESSSVAPPRKPPRPKLQGQKDGHDQSNKSNEKMPPPPSGGMNQRASSDCVTQLLLDEKRRQAGGYVNHDLDMYAESAATGGVQGSGGTGATPTFVNRNQHHHHHRSAPLPGARDDETVSSFTNNSLSTAPEPPSLREYRGVFFKPGAYRIKEDGEARQADLDSVVSSIRTHSTLRTNRTNRNADVNNDDAKRTDVGIGVPIEATVVVDEDDYLVVHADPIPIDERRDDGDDELKSGNSPYPSHPLPYHDNSGPPNEVPRLENSLVMNEDIEERSAPSGNAQDGLCHDDTIDTWQAFFSDRKIRLLMVGLGIVIALLVMGIAIASSRSPDSKATTTGLGGQDGNEAVPGNDGVERGVFPTPAPTSL